MEDRVGILGICRIDDTVLLPCLVSLARATSKVGTKHEENMQIAADREQVLSE